MRRWDCPNGEHAGVLAPSRLRKIDARRYCLDCTAATGLLVERMCAANEKVAERSKAKSKRKAQTKRSKVTRGRDAAKQAQRDREVVDGIDLAREVDRVWAHALKLQGPGMQRSVPRLSVERTTRWAGGHAASGRAYSSGRIHLSVGPGCSRYRLCGVIAHEVTHHMAWGDGHSDRFWSCLAELVLEAYGTQPTRLLTGLHVFKQRAVEDGIELGCGWLRQGRKPPRKPAAPRAGRARVESVREAATHGGRTEAPRTLRRGRGLRAAPEGIEAERRCRA